MARTFNSDLLLPPTREVQHQSPLAREELSKAEKDKLKGKRKQGPELIEPRVRRSGVVEIHEPGEQKRKSDHARDKPSKRSRGHARDLEVTAIPMDESFLKQAFEEWRADPIAASVRVMAEVGHVHQMWTEKKLKDIKAQLTTALDKKSLAEQELAAKDTALKTAKETVERLRDERSTMMRARDDALLKVVGLENKVTELTTKEKEAANRIRVLEN